MVKDMISVEIPVEVYKKIENRIKDTEFTTVSEYVTFVLEEVLESLEEDEEGVFSKEDEEKIKERLRALGYLD